MMDPAITLFGKRIQVNGEEDGSPPSIDECINESFDSSEHHEAEDSNNNKELTEEESVETNHPDESSAIAMEECTDPPAMAETDDQIQKAIDSNKDCESPKDEQESNDGKNPQQKQLKKPDKILPCPRCNSMDTKFCYYNNYNINQPRHFCKSCQRYWTAGGTMRNVPVGAGRRKNKSSVSRYCHITVSEALQAARLDMPNGVHHPGMKTNGTVLTFGSDNPLCDSMSSVLNLADKKVMNGTNRNGFLTIDHVVPVGKRGVENGDDRSSCSTITTSSAEDHAKKGRQEANQHMNGFTNQMPCFQWPYMWNPAVPVPQGFCPSPFPMPIYPPPYWNGTAMPWNVHWMPQGAPGQKSPGSNSNSPTLGKHSRDGEIIIPSDNDRSSGATTPTTVLVPKTLRIDDPDDAAKSSIWTTLGIKKDKGDVSKGFFNSFQSKEAEKNDCELETPPELKVNPAALCRSMSFQERA